MKEEELNRRLILGEIGWLEYAMNDENITDLWKQYLTKLKNEPTEQDAEEFYKSLDDDYEQSIMITETDDQTNQ